MKKRKFLLILTATIVIATMLTVTIASALGSGAYFTDDKTVDNNDITLGTLSITTNPTTQVIKYENIAPGWNYQDPSHWGYLVYPQTPAGIVVQNKGTLPVKYRMQAQMTGGTYNDALLDEVLVQVLVETGQSGTINNVFSGHLRDLLAWHTIDTNFGPTGHHDWYGDGERVRVYMAVPPTAGNEIQGKSISFDLAFDATQTDNPAW